MRWSGSRLAVAILAAAAVCAPLEAQSATPQTPASGWAVHTIGFDDNWVVSQWLPQAQQSGAGWVRDPVYFQSWVFGSNPDGTYVPIVGANPARWMDVNAIRDYAAQAVQMLQGGFHLALTAWASMDPGDEDTAAPVLIELLDQIKLALGAQAPTYLSRVIIEHFNEPNIYSADRPDIHVEPDEYVQLAAQMYTALKANPSYRNIPFLVGALFHFGLDNSCGDGWTPTGLLDTPAGAPARCANYVSGGPDDSQVEFGFGWLTQILQLGVMNYADGFSAHPYRFSYPEQGFTLISPDSDPEGFIDEIRMWVARVESYNTTAKPLIYQFTEIGYPSGSAGLGVGSVQRQGDYFTRTWTMLFHEQLLAQKKIDQGQTGGYRLTSYDYNTLKDDCIGAGSYATLPCGDDLPDEGKTDGLLTWDLQPKIGFEYYTQLSGELRADVLDAAESTGLSVSNAGVPVYTRLFHRKDNTGWVLAAWTGTPDLVANDVDISVAVDQKYLDVRRTDLTAQGPVSTVEVPFSAAGPGTIVLPHVQLYNRVSFFKIRTASPIPFDFDGDGKSDIAVFRPSDGTWRWLTSSSGYSTASAQVKQWGHSGDIPLSADFDGDGIADLAIYRPCDGFVQPCGARWYWLTSSSGYDYASQQSVQWGAPTDVPVPGDYDGDGKTDIAVWRPSTGTWYVLPSSAGYSYASQWNKQWGAPTDMPMPADYDGDGRTDIAVWRPSTGVWYWLSSSTGYDYGSQRGVEWGIPGDVPIAADYDGDGRADLAIWRPSEGQWYILLSSTGYVYAYGFTQGANGQDPMIGDFNANGQTDLAVFVPSSNTWSILSATGTTTNYVWGKTGDIPLISR